ncbi:putative proteasome subunit alpha type-7 [Cucumispora dikerogammari]|nr:putative proteasome subunit alpha type-7 [Cucumispora dikerogammari]
MAQQADFGPFFSQTGNLYQIAYAQKKVDSSPTILGMKSKHGIVILTEKPIEFKFQKIERKRRIHKITDRIYITQTGIQTDVIPLKNWLIEQEKFYTQKYHEGGSCGKRFNRLVTSYLSTYSRNWSTRPLGLNIISGVYDGKYNLYKTDTSGLSKSYKACAAGKGASRATTELEKLKFDEMTITEMVKEGIKIFYKTFDDTKDSEFKIEVATISNETENNFKILKETEYEEFIEEFQGLTIDD